MNSSTSHLAWILVPKLSLGTQPGVHAKIEYPLINYYTISNTMQSLSGITKIRSKKTGVLLLLMVAILTTILMAAGLSNMKLLPGETLPLAGILDGCTLPDLDICRILIKLLKQRVIRRAKSDESKM